MPAAPKIGSFIFGVCHPGQRMDLMARAGFNFARKDTPYPFDETGGEAVQYAAYKDLCRELMTHGIAMMGITPYPMEFLRHGVNPATPAGLKKVEEVCAHMAEDLKGLVKGWQVTNEMNVFHFREPLSLRESIDFVLAGLRGVRRGNPDALNGYNTAGTSADALMIVEALRPHQHLMDYIGLDSYCGTWSDGEAEDILCEIDRVYELTGLPVILQEFGFASEGTDYTPVEEAAYLRAMGYEDADAVRREPQEFLMKIPYAVADMAMTKNQAAWGDNALILMPHLLKKWPGGSRIYRHTPQGQAAFFAALLPRVTGHPHVVGAFIYCWSDTPVCRCGDSACCCETAWGVTDKHETPKPLFDLLCTLYGPK